jgi:hypothetical protein
MKNHSNHFLKTFGGDPQGNEKYIDSQVLADSNPKAAINCYSIEESFFLEATVEEVDKAISKTACGKASGADLIGAEAYKFGGVAIRSVLSSFFTLCGKTQITPNTWRESIIIPIYKKKGEKTDIANYRPIALTIVAKRILEKLIDSKLGHFKTKLQSSQGGFLKKRSTLHQIYFILELMKKNPDLIQIFLDLSAAYDMVDRRILWTQLKNHFGMPISLIRLLRSLFDENFSKLHIYGEKSEKIQHLRGLPQGSSLSPILFNFFIDSLIRKIQQPNLLMDFVGIKTNNLFFADDGNVHSNEPSIIQKILDICNDWELDFGMKFSPSKCLVLSKQNNLNLHIGGNVLPQVEEAVYLGIPLSATGFSSKSFAKSCSRKMEASLMQVVKGGYGSKFWSPGIRFGVFKQFIRPTAEYGLQLKIMDTSVLDVLESSQLKASRIMLQLPWNCSIQAIRRLFCMESMQCRNKILNAKFFHSMEKLQDYDQITKLVQFTSNESNSLYKECLKLNECIRDLKSISNESDVKNKIRKIRRLDILDPTKGCKSRTKPSTRISDSIPVSKSLKLSSILFWKTEEEGEIQRKLVRWRLGRTVFHQKCLNCNNESLSRKHATLCSGIDLVLFDKYQEIDSFHSENILDILLNKYMFGNHMPIWKDIFWAITQIQILCLGFTN